MWRVIDNQDLQLSVSHAAIVLLRNSRQRGIRRRLVSVSVISPLTSSDGASSSRLHLCLGINVQNVCVKAPIIVELPRNPRGPLDESRGALGRLSNRPPEPRWNFWPSRRGAAHGAADRVQRDFQLAVPYRQHLVGVAVAVHVAEAHFRPAHAGRSVHAGRCRYELVRLGSLLWCRLTESNRRPTVYKTAALPAELSRPCGHFSPADEKNRDCPYLMR